MPANQTKFPNKITEPFIYKFTIEASGIYLITLSARASGKEDLRVELDGKKFREILAQSKPQYFDIPPTWNGTRLQGRKQTVLFIIQLFQGEHQLTFIPDQSAIIETAPQIQPFNSSRIEINLEDQAEDGNRRPWYTVVLVDFPLKEFAADITTKWGFADSDDVKLVVDNQIQKNELSLLHRNWLWAGSIWKKLFQQERQQKTLKFNVDKGLHYLELWADRKPILHKIVLDLGGVESNILTGRIALYSDIEQTEFVELRTNPNTTDPEFAQLQNGEVVEILERIVRGERITNKSRIWHKVRYQDKVGYILSSFVEISGQEREQIIAKIHDQAKTHNIDPDYVVSLAGCESRYKPYAVSNTGALGIFQLTSKAREHLRASLGFSIDDSEEQNFDVDKNIAAALTYLNWLFNKYHGTQDEYQKVTAAWNAGASLIPAKGPITFQYIESELKRLEVQRLVNCVEQNRSKKDWRNIVLPIILLIGLGTYLLFPRLFSSMDAKERVMGIQTNETPKFEFRRPNFGNEIITVTTTTTAPFEMVTDVEITLPDRGFHKSYSGGLINAYLFDVDGGWKLAIVRSEGQYEVTSILGFDGYKKDFHDIKFVDKKGAVSDELCCNPMLLKNRENGNYNVAMIDSLSDPPRERIYEYNYLQHTFIEKN